MKVSIIVSSQSPTLRQIVDKKRESLVPKEIRKTVPTLAVRSIAPCANTPEVCCRLLEMVEGFDLVCLAVDEFDAFLTCDLFEGLLIGRFAAADVIENPGNAFGRLFSIFLRNAIFLERKFKNMGSFRTLTLPMNLFSAPEMNELLKVTSKKSVDRTFPASLETVIASINSRRCPKRFGSGQQHFLRDDADRYFRLDESNHRRVNTSAPHDDICRLRAFFRFGVALDRHKHFDVSRGKPKQDLSGTFPTCHGLPVSFSAVSHLNVFPNGYLEA